jgi:hypothetical protein
MTVVELKEKLIENIRNTDNEELLEHISDIFEFKLGPEGTYEMSAEEIEAVKEGIEQIENGRFLTNEEVIKLSAECLKK